MNTDREIEIKPSETQRTKRKNNKAKHVRAVGQYGIHTIGVDRERGPAEETCEDTMAENFLN